MCQGNVMAGLIHDTKWHKNVRANRVYIIDFDSSRQFELGPGIQPAIILPETQTDKPNGSQLFDPYSWDMYCTGRTLEALFKVR